MTSLVNIPTYNEAIVLDRIFSILLVSLEGHLPKLMSFYWQNEYRAVLSDSNWQVELVIT